MRKNNEEKRNIFSLINLSYAILMVVIFFTIGYSSSSTNMNITGLVSHVRPEEDIRITKVEVEDVIETASTSYTDYNKDRLFLGVNLPNKTSEIKYKLEITNIGNVEMGIYEISGLPEELEYELEDYILQDKLCNGSGECSLGIKKEFYITLKYKEDSQVQNNTYDLNLKLEFRKMHNVIYDGIVDNNYKDSVIDGGDLQVTFVKNIPKVVVPYINGEKVLNYSYINNTIIVENVTADITLKNQKVYLMQLSPNNNFKTSDYLTKIKTISFVNHTNIPTDALITYNLEVNKGDGIKGWIDKDYNLYIGSEWEIYAENLSRAFQGMTSVTTINLDNLNTSETTLMQYMFYNCTSLESLDINSFNTEQVTRMDYMFHNCKLLASLNISNFNTSNVTRMDYMFYNCKLLSSVDVADFNTNQVTNMEFMFYNCDALTEVDVSNFNTSNVTNMGFIFYGCGALTTLDVSNFNTANVTNMDNMFYNCESLTELDVSGFNTEKVEIFDSMFSNCKLLTSIDVSNFNTANATNMEYMFYNCKMLVTVNVSKFITNQVTNMEYMFYNCNALTEVDVSSFNTSAVNNMQFMFFGCSALTTLDVSNFNTSSVTNMKRMFSDCSVITSLNLSNFNTSNVTSMEYMFSGCTKLSNLNINNFDTSNVTTMAYMFYTCKALTTLDISSFDTSNVTTMANMFNGDSKLKTVYVSDLWDTTSVTTSTRMVNNCNAIVGEQGTKYNGSYIDKTYARVDGGTSSPGYFTYKEYVANS